MSLNLTYINQSAMTSDWESLELWADSEGSEFFNRCYVHTKKLPSEGQNLNFVVDAPENISLLLLI